MSEKGNLKYYKYIGIIIALVIIIIVIILDIIFENYSKEIIEKVNNKIERIDKIFVDKTENENFEEIEKLSNELIEEWEKRQKILTCFIEHEEIDNVNVKLHILNSEIKNNSWSNAKSTLTETKQLIKCLNVKHKLSLQNLF